MPYADEQKRRAYQRDYRRRKRAGETATPAKLALPAEFRLQTALDALELLTEQIALVRADESLGTIERARCIAQLIGVSLRAIEAGDLAARLEAIETVLRERRRSR